MKVWQGYRRKKEGESVCVRERERERQTDRELEFSKYLFNWTPVSFIIYFMIKDLQVILQKLELKKLFITQIISKITLSSD